MKHHLLFSTPTQIWRLVVRSRDGRANLLVHVPHLFNCRPLLQDPKLHRLQLHRATPGDRVPDGCWPSLQRHTPRGIWNGSQGADCHCWAFRRPPDKRATATTQSWDVGMGQLLKKLPFARVNAEWEEDFELQNHFGNMNFTWRNFWASKNIQIGTFCARTKKFSVWRFAYPKLYGKWRENLALVQ